MSNWGWVALWWFAVAGIIVTIMWAGGKRPHDDSAPIQKWPKPTPGDDLPEDAVKFAQITSTCPFCHTDLHPGPRGGIMQNMFCLGCNSRINIATLVRPHYPLPPIGQYLGPIPDEVRTDIVVQKLKGNVQKFLDDHPRELDK